MLYRVRTQDVSMSVVQLIAGNPPDSKVCVVANTVNFEGNLPQYQKTMEGYSLLET